MQACAAVGALANLAEAWNGANEVEVRFSSPWFWLICGVKALCGKEAFLVTAFLVTFVATKVTCPPAAKSGYAPYNTRIVLKRFLRTSQ